MLPSPEAECTSDSSLTGDSRILRPDLEVENDRTEAESESSDDRICCGAGNGALVEDSETMEPELETDDNNLGSESEISEDGVCCLVKSLPEDSEASTLEPGSDNDTLETDSEYSGCKECCRALLNSRFHSQK